MGIPILRFVSLALVGALLTAACSDSSGPETAATAAAPDRPIELGSPDAIPPLELSTVIVDPATVVFDTFDGGSVTLADADAATIDSLLDAIAPIDAPDYEPAGEADWLVDDDLVLGFVDTSGAAWAFPVRVLNFHEIVKDQFDGVPVLVSYCPLCGSGVVFDRRLDGRLLSFSNTSALHENDLVMVDRETGSYWWQVPGRALAAAELDVLPSQTTTWRQWSDDHPDTTVMVRPPLRDFERDPFVGYAELLDQGRTSFPVDPDVLADPRLSPGNRVVAATIDGETRAWPTDPARTVDDIVAGRSVTVETDGVGGRVVTSAGEAVPTRTSYWFAIVAAFPDVTVGP